MSDRDLKETSSGVEPVQGFKGKPLVINGSLLLALTAFALIDALTPPTDLSPRMGYMAAMIGLVGGLGLCNFVLGLASACLKKHDLASSLLLSSALIWMIGAGLCFGIAPMMKGP